MAIKIKINNVEKQNLVDWQSVRFQSVLNSQVDTFEFAIKRYGAKNFKPELNDDVEFWNGTEKLFGGKIVQTEETIEARLEKISVLCKDHSHEADRKLVVRIYQTTAIEDIIEDIKNTYLPAGFTTTNVVCPIVANYIAFNYEQPTKCFQQLADLVGYAWYIDPDKDIHFKSRLDEIAPFGLTDTNGKYVFNSLRIRKDVKNLRNTIYVRGGEYKGSTYTEKETADGVAKVFKQGFRYDNISVKKGGASQTIGIDNIDDPTTKDVLYNFQEKAVKFRDDNKPVLGTEIEVSGLPYIPVIIKTKDNVSISQYGTFEYKVIDKSLNSKEGARDRTKQELFSWALESDESGFVTYEGGLRVGNLIRIQSTIRAIDDNFLINRITVMMKSPDKLAYQITCVASETFKSIEFLQKLLMDKDKEITINANEVLDKVEMAIEEIVLTEATAYSLEHHKTLETITLTESKTVQALNYPTEFVLAPFPIPTGYKRELALDGGALA